MPAVAAHQLALAHLRLHEEGVQVLERLLVGLELLGSGGLLGEFGEAQLCGWMFVLVRLV